MQITELEFDDFHEIRFLFTSSKHLRFTIEAAIAGNSPMRIWVDKKNMPTSAFLWDKAHCYYLGGDAGNRNFCDGIENILKFTLIPNAISINREIFKIEYSSKEWEPILRKILGDITFFKMSRKFFELYTRLIPQWRDLLPSGFVIKRIDKNLINSDVKNKQTIINEINECWNSVDDFLSKGFGFYVAYSNENGEEEVQGWCTGEYFSEGKCGIGIEIFQDYQKRGLGTLIASAFVEYSLSVGIDPHWDSSANNKPSVSVAKKTGFKLIQDYDVLFGTFSNSESFKGNYYFGEKDFKKAAQWFEKAAESDQSRFYNYYNAACSWALIGEINFALEDLNKSLDNLEKPSSRFINHLKQNSKLKNLYQTEEWKLILQRLDDIEKKIKDQM